jgi:hypothetical protein
MVNNLKNRNKNVFFLGNNIYFIILQKHLCKCIFFVRGVWPGQPRLAARVLAGGARPRTPGGGLRSEGTPSEAAEARRAPAGQSF